MEPIKFKEHNTVYAKDQPQYLPLPAYKDEDGLMICCWKLTLMERLKLLITGKLWLKLLTFNKPLQPLRPMIDSPFIKEKV